MNFLLRPLPFLGFTKKSEVQSVRAKRTTLAIFGCTQMQPSRAAAIKPVNWYKFVSFATFLGSMTVEASERKHVMFQFIGGLVPLLYKNAPVRA